MGGASQRRRAEPLPYHYKAGLSEIEKEVGNG